MKAYQLTQWGKEGEFVEVSRPEPGPLDVLIRVKAVGLCRTDLDMMECLPGAAPFATVLEPGYTLGHEVTGFVEQTGAQVTDLKFGEAVVVHHIQHCGYCEWCESGMEQYCENYLRGGIPLTRGVGVDGGLAEFLVCPRTEVISIGDEDPVMYAPLTDAGVTAYSACLKFMHELKPGSYAAVLGVGGLGAYAVQILKLMTTAYVIAIDNSDERLRYATELGADAVVKSDDSTATKIRELTKGKGVDGLIDLVGNDQTMRLAADVVRPHGFISVAGMGGGTVQLGWGHIASGVRFCLSLGSTRQELREICQLAREGKLRIDIDRFTFDQIPQAYEQLRQGKLHGRAVIVM
jgi:propanol-preferring alcohol dehydrogenase